MPIASIKLRPGIDSQKTYVLNEGGWSSCNLIRFKDGLPQPIGGWQIWWTRQLDSAVRAIHSWADLNGNVWTGVGTDYEMYVIGLGTQANITPTTVTSNPSPDFSTTSGSSAITVVDGGIGSVNGTNINLVTPVSVGGLVLQGVYTITSILTSTSYTITAAANATSTVSAGGAVPSFTTTSGSPAVTVVLDNHGQTVGSSFAVNVATAVGGLTLSGSYLVQGVTSSNQFTIDAASSATSSATASENGGDAQIVYYGVAQTGNSYAYGIGGYGEGGYGQGSQATGVKVSLWTMDNWGETLIFCPSGGGIYTWTPSTGQTQGQLITAAPSVNNGIFIAMPQLTLVAWGSSVSGEQQPLLVSWSTVGDYTQWTPLVTNQAGSYTIPSGSRVVGALQGPYQGLIWTDVDLYAMNYLGGIGQAELAWGFTKIADHCGLVSARAACVLNDAVFWLSPGQFMVYAGEAPQAIHCTVWDQLFQDLDWSNVDKVIAAGNSQFHEVWWFYPSISGGTGECDSYVKFNMVEKTWDFGKMARTGWQDYSAAGNPIGGDPNGNLWQHEVGYLAAGQPMNWSISTGAIMIAEGDHMMFVDWLLPDFQWGFANQPSTNQPVNVTLNAYRFANDTPQSTITLQFSQSGEGYSYLRQRGRHLAFTFGGPGFARIGNVRYRAAPDGRY